MTIQRVVARQPPVQERQPSAALIQRTAAPQVLRGAQLLQRRLGNQGTMAFAARSTGSLRISSSTDPAEREAVAVAARVMRSPESAPTQQSAPNIVQRAAVDTTAPATNAGGDIHSAMTGSGSALPRETLGFMEPRLGRDLHHVRVHTGAQAAELSERVDAHAFTVGQHIFFGKDQFRPHEPAGKELIAHELTHTIQQGGAASGTAHPSVQREEKKSWWQEIVDFGEAEGWKLVRAVSPGIADVLQKGPSGILDWLKERATAALQAVFDFFMAPVRAFTGVGQELSALFAPMVVAIQTAAGQIARNDCTPLREAADKIEKTATALITPIIAKVQPIVAAVKGFFNTLWEKIGAPIWDVIKEYAAQQWEQIKWLASQIQALVSWIWDKTAWVRSLAQQAWDWLKDKIGIGDKPEGQDGLLQWAQKKLDALWTTVKAALEPFRKELTAIAVTAGAVLLAVSPAGPILAIGAAVAGAIQGLRWIHANWGKGNLVVQARVYLEKILIPPLLGAIARLNAAVTRVANAISSALTSVAAALTRAIGSLSGTVLRFAVAAVQWIADQAAALTAWAHQELDQLAVWVAGSIGKLQVFLHNMLEFFGKVGAAILDIWGLPVLLAEKIWNWVPACIRDPIVDFIGPIILQQIELFRELGKDNEAWQKTKADIGKLIKLVFKDHDLIGAVKAAFMLVLRVFNIPPDLLTKIIAKAMAAWDIISKKPLDFIKNTVRALAYGFKLLWGRIGFHLEYGLKGWLLGVLGEAKLTPPASWTDPKELFFFALQVLGLSVDHLFELLAKRFDAAAVKRLRVWYGRITRAVDWINRTIDVNKSPEENTKGLIAQAKDFGKTILTGLVTWITTKIAEELAIMAASAAASAGLSEVLDIARRIYKALVTAQRWARRILDMVDQALDYVLDLATGSIEKVGGVFENIMHQGMPVVIGFLADQVGLGGIGDEIRDLVERLRAKVDEGVLWVIDKVKAALDAIVGAVKSAAAAVLNWWQERRKVPGADGKTHDLYFDASKQLVIASEICEVTAFLERVIDDKKSSKEVKGKAVAALAFFQKKLLPVQNGTKETALVNAFGANLTDFANLMGELVGAGDVELPAEAKWTREAPTLAAAELLSTRTSRGGTEPSEPPLGWELLQKYGLTKKHGDWKQMHLITAGVGGLGVRGNLLPAPTRVNSGSPVRGFELRVESLVKAEDPKTKKPNVIWIKVEAVGYYEKTDLILANTFAKAISLKAGLHFIDTDKPEGDKWVKNTRAEVEASDSIPPPDFNQGPIDLDSVGRVYIEKATGTRQSFAQKVVKVRPPGGFKSLDSFREKMEAERGNDTEFSGDVLKVEKAVEGSKPTARFGLDSD
jgi:hypothetical protein